MSLALLLAAALAAPRDVVPVRTFPFAAEGVIEADDNRDPGSSNHYDAYRLRLTAGTRYRITVTPSGPPEQPNPRPVFGPPTTRDYVLRVLNLTSMHVRPPSRAYRLEITPLTAAEVNVVAVPATVEQFGWRVWDGRFTAGDPVDSEGRRFHEYRLRLVAGQTRIVLAERLPDGDRRGENREIGLALQIRAADAPVDTREFLAVAAGALDSPPVATVRPEQTGEYIMRVTAPASSRPESYRMRISE